MAAPLAAPVVAQRADFDSYTSMPAPLGQSLRVLVVEDDPVQALVLMLFLERLGVAATHVTDGQQAIEAVKSGGFSLVLMDYLMPTANGIEATLAIRAWEATVRRVHTPIVAVTASAMKDECEGYIDAGMDDVLVKPFSAKALRELVSRHLRVELRERPGSA